MPTFSPQTSPFADIVLAAKTRLVVGLDLDPTFVRIVASDNYTPETIAEPRFIFLRYYSVQPFADAGAGRLAMPVTRLLRAYIYSRSSVDEAESDEVALTDPDVGQAAFEEQVLGLLVNWFPVGADGKEMTIEPFHPLDPSSGPPERKTEEDVGIIRSSLLFEVRYLLRVDRTEPAA